MERSATLATPLLTISKNSEGQLMVGIIPILDMGYDTAERLRILHLHVLHILDFLLAYRNHGICLCQADKRCVIEHSSDDSGSFYQPA